MQNVTPMGEREPSRLGKRLAEQEVITAFAKGGDTRDAVTIAARRIALHLDRPTLLMLFVGGKHDPKVALAGVGEIFPGVPVIGGSGAGVISSDGFGYSGMEIGIAAWRHERVAPRISFTGGLLNSDYEAGVELGRLARAQDENCSVVVLLYDSVRSFEPRRLHVAGSLVDGFYDGWGPGAPSVLGGGALTDLNLTDGWIFANGEVRRHAALALSFPACVKAETVVLRACRPVSSYMKVTKIKGSEVYELDGLPALDVVESYMARPLIDAEGHPTRIMTLGHKIGDPFEDGGPDEYINRLILTGDRRTSSITLFEPDFRNGDLVQIMASDADLMIDEARRGAQLVKRTSGRTAARRPIMHLYIDCAGRASVVSGTRGEEAGVVVEELDDDRTPLVGFYSGVEIAPMKGRSRPLDWTGVLTTFIETF